MVRDIKNNASDFVKGKFAWQESFGSFSYSHSHLGIVFDYLFNQEKHHRKKSFKQEYLDFLKKFEVDPIADLLKNIYLNGTINRVF